MRPRGLDSLEAPPGIHRILLVHTGGGLGDLVTAIPLVAALKQRFPASAITVWTLPAHAPILEEDPHVATVWTFADRAPAGQMRAAIREARFDLAVFTWARWRQAWLAYLAGVPHRVGPARRLAWSFLFNTPVRVRTELGDVTSHAVDVQLDYPRALGWSGIAFAPSIRLKAEDRRLAGIALSTWGIGPEEAVSVLQVGKGLRVDRVRWPIDCLVEIGRGVAAMTGFRVLVTGSANERAVAGRVVEGIGTAALNLAGLTPDLRTFCGIIDRAALAAGIDSGPMHVAAALGVPVMSIFPLLSDLPERWRPFGPEVRVVGTDGWRCPLRCVKETCVDFACLSHIDVEAALRACRDLLPAVMARAAAHRPKWSGRTP